MVASTMLKGGFANRTLQYADVSSMTRTWAADSVMIHAHGATSSRRTQRSGMPPDRLGLAVDSDLHGTLGRTAGYLGKRGPNIGALLLDCSSVASS
jgi:hypothetical protein